MDSPAAAGGGFRRNPCACSRAHQPLERVKIPRLAWSLAMSSALSFAALPFARAQDQHTDQPATHTVKRGDTLWDLAKKYLGDAYLCPASTA